MIRWREWLGGRGRLPLPRAGEGWGEGQTTPTYNEYRPIGATALITPLPFIYSLNA